MNASDGPHISPETIVPEIEASRYQMDTLPCLPYHRKFLHVIASLYAETVMIGSHIGKGNLP